MRKVIFLLATIGFLVCSSNNELRAIGKQDLERLMKTNTSIQLLDVRTLVEFQRGHIPESFLIDVTKDDFLEKAAVHLDSSKPIYLYCKKGNRSIKAGKLLSSNKYTNIYYLEGGYTSWNQKNN